MPRRRPLLAPCHDARSLRRTTLGCLLAAVLVLGFSGPGIAQSAGNTGFDADFTGATLRLYYYHAGTASEEHLALDEVRVEGPWRVFPEAVRLPELRRAVSCSPATRSTSAPSARGLPSE